MMERLAFSRRTMLAAGASLALAPALPAIGAAKRPAKPLVLGHRGAPAHRPEHTLASYAKAIADGADFVEPDLVATKDGVLVARHENNIAETTDVAAHAEFAARKTTKTIDGQATTGWFSEDFTLAELKTLRAKERLGVLRPESQSYDDQFQIVTFEEIADFVAAEAAARGRTVGLIPEIKHSTYFAGIGLPLEPRFLAVLRASAYLKRAPVIVQSFETGNLKALRPEIADMGNVQLMQLVDPSQPALVSPAGLAGIAAYADWVAPPTRAIIPLGPDGRLAAPTQIVADAHAAGLLVGTWTFRPENSFLAADFRDGAGPAARNPAGSIAEIRRYLTAGLDGFFTDDPALGREAVDAMSSP
jgi:glycerophosphoryl diester phosphodiesterase